MTLEGLELLIAIVGIAVTLLVGILSLMYSFANKEEDRSKAELERIRQEITNEIKAEVYRDLAGWVAIGLQRERPFHRLVDRDVESGDEEQNNDEPDSEQRGNYS